MDASGIDLNLLRLMQVVDQEGSVTRAAQRLGLSQPAVSNGLARLRRALGDPLFVRSSTGMEPTPRARRVLEALDSAMGLIRLGLREGVEFDPAVATDEFSLLVSDLGELTYLPRLMEHVEQHAPGCRLRVRQLARGGYAEALEAGRADLAVGYLPHPRGSLRSRRLFTDRFVCMLRAGHPALEQPFTLERYLALSHVAVSRAGGREGLVTTMLAGLGAERRIALVIPHFAAAPGVVAATDLAVAVPSQLADVYAGAGVVTLPLPFDVPRIEIALYWHDRLQEDPASRWLRGVFVALFGRSDGHYSPE